jgi:uncharacterized lipoprotein
MKKTVLLLAMVTAALLMAGCSESNVRGNVAEGQSSKQQASPKKEKTVEPNEGMTKKEEKDLQERLADLEDRKVGSGPHQLDG